MTEEAINNINSFMEYYDSGELHKNSKSKYEELCEQMRADSAELKKAKRLLRLAVEDLNSVARALEGNDILCMKYIACEGCPFDGKSCDKWKHADEALKLTGGMKNE